MGRNLGLFAAFALPFTVYPTDPEKGLLLCSSGHQDKANCYLFFSFSFLSLSFFLFLSFIGVLCVVVVVCLGFFVVAVGFWIDWLIFWIFLFLL